MMTVELKGKKMIIEIDCTDKPQPSKTGKSKIVASSGGFQTMAAQVAGQPVRVNVTAII